MVEISPPISQEGGAERFRPVRIWLLCLIVLVFAMVLVGGVTRLMEAGLSITEWNLVTGTIPPLLDEAWQEAFDRYRQSPQYELMNSGMSLDAFKTIYWWEWGHRELGRFIGLVYVGGFVWIVVRRAVSGRTFAILAGMGLLLGLQGLVGWIMVASGLQPGMTAVAPVRLMLHLTLAALFFAALVTAFVSLGGAVMEDAAPGLRWTARLLVVVALGQIALGALVAGHDAGLTYNTWPLMDGRFVPRGLWSLDPGWLNVVDNVTTIQFNHRIGAYVLLAAFLAYGAAAFRAESALRTRAILMTVLLLAQVGVGIATLVRAVPIGFALMHQALAMILLLALVWNASVLARGTS
jgi:cytochrome c oxidase assembly protein subunit 15